MEPLQSLQSVFPNQSPEDTHQGITNPAPFLRSRHQGEWCLPGAFGTNANHTTGGGGRQDSGSSDTRDLVRYLSAFNIHMLASRLTNPASAGPHILSRSQRMWIDSPAVNAEYTLRPSFEAWIVVDDSAENAWSDEAEAALGQTDSYGAGGLPEQPQRAAAPASEDRMSEFASRVRAAVTQAADREETAVSPNTVEKTMAFLASSCAELPLPAVVIESENEIGLDWDEGPEKVVSLTIDSSNRIGFAALFGREPLYGKAECVDGLPETIRYLLARLYPSALLR